MEEFRIHGMEAFVPYVINRKIPPSDLVAELKNYVQSVSTKYNLPLQHALEDVVRSLMIGVTKQFKKDARLFLQKSSKSRKYPLNLNEYEMRLADVIDRYDGEEFEGFSVGLSEDEHEEYSNQFSVDYEEFCPVHKKDCRQWLHKRSGISKVKVGEVSCEWFKIHKKKFIKKKKKTAEDVSGAGDTPSVIVEDASDPDVRNTPDSGQRVRFRAPDKNCSSDESEEDDNKAYVQSKRRKNHLSKTDDVINKNSEYNQVQALKNKITSYHISNTMDPQKDLSNNSLRHCGSDTSSRSSDELQRIAEADEILARKIYESDMQAPKMNNAYYRENGPYPINHMNYHQDITQTQKLHPIYEVDRVNSVQNTNLNSHLHQSDSLETMGSGTESNCDVDADFKENLTNKNLIKRQSGDDTIDDCLQKKPKINENIANYESTNNKSGKSKKIQKE